MGEGDSPGNSALGERSCYSHHTPLHDRWGVICGAEKARGRNRCGKEGKRKVLVWVCETEDATNTPQRRCKGCNWIKPQGCRGEMKAGKHPHTDFWKSARRDKILGGEERQQG